MKLKSLIFFILGLVFSLHIFASDYVQISTNNTCLLFKVDDKNHLQQIYFGKKIKQMNELESVSLPNYAAYATSGTTNTNEAALSITHADGNTSTELSYVSSKTVKQDDNTVLTTISLKDEYYDVTVDLNFKAYQTQDVIEQWVEIKNNENKTISLENFASSYLSFFSPKYYVTQFYGDWANEMNMVEQELTPGIKVIDSKLGVRADQYATPCFLLGIGNKAEENNGDVIGGTLAWPGSFQFRFEVDNNMKLHVLSGINPYLSTYVLDKGKTFKTPSFLFTYSSTGTETVTHNFHHWALKYGIKNGDKDRTVLLNNWESTYFDFNEEKLSKIIDQASKMGFELFLLDDGWFGNKYPRNNDDAGLGDWQVNKKKLPHGIPYLVNDCKEKGLKFGIWIEPEMVNPKSELYEQHPDWVIAQPHRERTTQRNQLILDLTNPKVQDFVYNSIDNLLSQNPGIAYVKWDCNRFVENGGSSYLSADRQSNIWVDYNKALLKIMDKVSQKYANITFMLCSGGGGRIDYASMKHFDEYWISDNNDPLQRIFTQWGTQYFFPTIGLASHVSVSPNHISGREMSIKYRFDVAMAAKLGMDMDPEKMSDADKTFSKNAIETYKKIRKTVLMGDLYRILSPYKSNRVVFMYVNDTKSEAIVFNFLIRKEIKTNTQTVFLKGLDPNKMYNVQEINRESPNWSRSSAYANKSFSGDYLMTVGLTFPMYNEYESVVLQLNSRD